MRQICPECGFDEHELALFCTRCSTRLTDQKDASRWTKLGGALKALLAPSTFFRIFAAIALIAAYFPQQYSYYTFLRIGVSLIASYVIFVSIRSGKPQWIVGFGFVALVFNPFVPLKEIERDTWKYVDLISAVFMLISIFFVGEKIRSGRSILLELLDSRFSRTIAGLMVTATLVIGATIIFFETSKQARLERERGINANRAVANAMNVAANAANAAALAAQQAANVVSSAANSVANISNSSGYGPPVSDFDPYETALPCDGFVENPSGNLSLRSEPKMSRDNKISELVTDDDLTINSLSTNGLWVNVTTSSGERGWVSRKWVKCN